MIVRTVSACLLSLVVLVPSLSHAVTGQITEQARVIVRFKAQSSALNAQALALTSGHPRQAVALSKRTGVSLGDGLAIDRRTQVVKAKGMSSKALAERLAADPDVEFAVTDRRVYPLAAPNDPRYAAGQSTTPAAGQWFLRAPDDLVTSAINAEAAWDITTGRASTVVAVLDTGVRRDHPDLAGKLLPGYDFITDRATANDGNGRDSDPSDPGDWLSEDDIGSEDFPSGECVAADSDWHGTKTAGLVGAATNNGVGIASVGRNVMVLPVRVLGRCGGFESDIQAAMRWAAGLHVDGVPDNPNPARVLNMSLGDQDATTCSAAYQAVVDELKAMKVVVVAAAGNAGKAIGRPANCNGVIGVTGLRHNGSKVGYSNLGSRAAIAAPAGNCVNEGSDCVYTLMSTTNSGATRPASNIYTDGDTRRLLGTSFASPLVAGTVGLMLSQQPGLTVAQVTSMLKSTARPFPTTGGGPEVTSCLAPTGNLVQDFECYCTTSTCGAGMLSTSAAVAAARDLEVNATAVILVSPTNVTEDETITVDAGDSIGSNGNDITSYRWSLTSGSAIASFSGSTTGRVATIRTRGAGSISVRLTIDDSEGGNASTTRVITVASDGSEDDDEDNGGASSALWLGLLALALAGLASSRRTPQRARA